MFKDNLPRVKKHLLLLFVMLSLLISFVNLMLLINLFSGFKDQVLVSESLPQSSTNEVEKSDKLALHIERLIVLDAIFNSERDQSREFSVEELMIIDSLFREKG